MILDQETLEKMGYLASSLTQGSNKYILVKCDYCGAQIKTTMKIHNKLCAIVNKDCCAKCKTKKREDICLIEHGVKNQFQIQSVKEKSKQTRKEKYGVEHYTQTKEFKEKAETTMMEKYGVSHSSQSEELTQKRKDTLRERYGVENPSQVNEFKEKRKQTNLEKFGTEQFLSSEYAKETIAATIKEKYGVDNVFQNEDIKKKIKQVCLDKYGVDHFLKNKENARIATERSLQARENNGNIDLIYGKRVSEYYADTKFCGGHFRKLIKQYGFDIAIKMEPKQSSLEQQVKFWLDEIGLKYTEQVCINKYKADFLLLDYNLIIEVDGLYWHCDGHCKDSKYHFNKQKTYSEAGFKSVFFREDELKNSFDIIKSIILNKCKLCDTKIYARQCKFDDNVDKRFFIDNHLMGKGSGQIFGLTYDNNVVAALQIKRVNGNHYEISRFCTKLNHTVVGGFSKLLNIVIKQLNPSSVFTFIDRRYGSGEYLITLGFQYISNNISFRWTDTDNTFHRMRYKGNTGYEHGLFKVWDCGQTKYILIL